LCWSGDLRWLLAWVPSRYSLAVGSFVFVLAYDSISRADVAGARPRLPAVAT
jgi:hypothetical protein